MRLRKNDHDLSDFQAYRIKKSENEQNFVKFLHIYLDDHCSQLIRESHIKKRFLLCK